MNRKLHLRENAQYPIPSPRMPAPAYDAGPRETGQPGSEPTFYFPEIVSFKPCYPVSGDMADTITVTGLGTEPESNWFIG